MRTVSTTATPGQVNHVLHLLLTVFTCGLWLPVWVAMAIASANSTKQTYTVTETMPGYGQPVHQLSAAPGWYPIQGGRQAWWDGQRWTGHTR